MSLMIRYIALMKYWHKIICMKVKNSNLKLVVISLIVREQFEWCYVGILLIFSIEKEQAKIHGDLGFCRRLHQEAHK